MDVTEWSLCIYSSSRSQTTVSPYNVSVYLSLLAAHSVHHEETNQSVELLLTLLKYNSYECDVIGDFKR